jgi:hypothetical protein
MLPLEYEAAARCRGDLGFFNLNLFLHSAMQVQVAILALSRFSIPLKLRAESYARSSGEESSTAAPPSGSRCSIIPAQPDCMTVSACHSMRFQDSLPCPLLHEHKFARFDSRRSCATTTTSPISQTQPRFPGSPLDRTRACQIHHHSPD